MYVCICNAVTQGEIRRAVEGGARCVRAVREVTAASTGCGTCLERVAALVEEVAVREARWGTADSTPVAVLSER